MAPSAILSEYPCFTTTTYIIMSQIHHRNTYRNTITDRHVVYEERKLDGTTMRLIKAPPVDDAPMWKGQAFDFARDRLRGRIGGSVTADSAITIMGEHFPMATMTAEEEARRVVSALGLGILSS